MAFHCTHYNEIISHEIYFVKPWGKSGPFSNRTKSRDTYLLCESVRRTGFATLDKFGISKPRN
jgi:hypothetical protein